MIRVPLLNDRNRYYESSDFEKSLVATIGNVTKIPGPLTFMNNRSRFLKKHKDFLFIPPEISSIQVRSRERYSRERIENYEIQATVSAFSNRVTIFYRFDEDGPFQSMPMMDDGEHYDEGAKDNIYGAIIKPKAGSTRIQYYIQAQNARTLSYYPTRYMYNQEEIFLADLNK